MKQKITLAVVAMAISLSGIIILQLYWINGAIKVRTKQFDSQVFDAINEVSDKLQLHESMMILPKILPGMDSVQRKTMDSIYSKRLAERHYRGRFGFRRKKHFHNFDDDPFKPDSEENNPALSQNGHNMFHSVADFKDSLLADSGKRLMAGSNIYGRVLRRMVMNYISQNKEITKRLSMHLVDSFLDHELHDRGIELPYAAAIVNKQTGCINLLDKKSDTTALKRSAYQVRLFTEDLAPQPYMLVVNFPDKQSFVIRSIGLILPGSFAFLLIIVISCGYTIYMLLSQKKLSEMKNDFINNMTHEFKTPIATISLATDAINDPRVIDNKEKLKHYTSVIKEENNRMNQQVQKVLNAALMEKEDFRLNRQPLDAHIIISQLAERFTLQINQRGGTLTLNGHAENPLINADEVHFGNVINNLLDNANKYSPETPKVTMSTYDEDGYLVISVEDNGIGMSKETQKRIFDKFFRMSTGNLHDTKGFGLGLHYVKAVITAHKGTITVKSELKKGSTFTVKLPLYKK